MRVVPTACGTLLFLALHLAVPAAGAAPSKADCKGHARSVESIAEELDIGKGTAGRALMGAVQRWIGEHDQEAVQRMVARIEAASEGVGACDAGGLSRVVDDVREMSTKLASALPWFSTATGGQDCQTLINEAVRTQDTDVGGAITGLEQYMEECQGHQWLSEARQRLAGLLYQRGDASKNDFRRAHELTRQALDSSESLDPEAYATLQAILARTALEAGDRLMQQQRWELAREHWEAWVELFGGPGFDVLFDVEQVARGAMSLSRLENADYQRALACAELGDVACLDEVVGSAGPELVGELAQRVARQAIEPGCEQAQELSLVAFELLSRWREAEPDAFLIETLLRDLVLERPREQRLELLSATDQCWIPMQAVRSLEAAGEPFVKEAEIAADCGESGAEARQMLQEVYAQAARSKLNELGTVAVTVAERRRVIAEIEQEFLPRLDAATAAGIRARLAEERQEMQQEAARATHVESETYAACTELLASVQWRIAREQEHEDTLAEFKRSCCSVLRSNRSAWVSWMRGRPANMRLADQEIDNKSRLMQEYCKP